MAAVVVIVTLAAVLGVIWFVAEAFRGEVEEGRKDGWVYFAAGADTAVKVGTSVHEPTQATLPHLRADNPEPLKIIHYFYTEDLEAAATQVTADLEGAHERDGWFDRDTTMYYIDHLKGDI